MGEIAIQTAVVAQSIVFQMLEFLPRHFKHFASASMFFSQCEMPPPSPLPLSHDALTVSSQPYANQLRGKPETSNLALKVKHTRDCHFIVRRANGDNGQLIGQIDLMSLAEKYQIIQMPLTLCFSINVTDFVIQSSL